MPRSPFSARLFLLTTLALVSFIPQARALALINSQIFLDRFFGVNTHLTNCCNSQFEATDRVINELRYIGATHLRDGPIPMTGLIDRWKTVRQATGVRMRAVIESGSPARQRTCLDTIRAWLTQAPGLISQLEGGNEEDTPYPVSQGATLADTAALQNTLYVLGKSAGLPVTQMSVGAGWAPPLWDGNYKNFGKPPADYGNAHVYMNKGEVPAVSLQRIGQLASWSVDGKPTDVTEFGMFLGAQQTPELTSAYMHIAPFTSFILGHARLAVYALHDDTTRAIGFFDPTGKPRLHADYWHVTSRLLADPGGRTIPPRSANIVFSAQRTVGQGVRGIKHAPLFKSDNSVWIGVYDEENLGAPDGAETITMHRVYPFLQVIDGQTGRLVQSLKNTNTVTVTLPANHLYFVVGAWQEKNTPWP